MPSWNALSTTTGSISQALPAAPAMQRPGSEGTIDPLQAITAVFTMEDAVGRSVARPRLLVVLLGAFGLAAVVLGAVGLYGIVRSLVGERQREMGLRLALGATPRGLSLMMVRQGLRLAAVGLALGIAMAWSATGWMQSVLYGIEATDALTFVAMTSLLLATAGLASWLPARRAGRVDPIQSLRD